MAALLSYGGIWSEKNEPVIDWRKVESMQERTLSIIKPDAIGKGLVGEVIKRFEQAGFNRVYPPDIAPSKVIEDLKRDLCLH